MKVNLFQMLFLLALPGFSARAQFCFSPQQPQAGQVVSFTYTPQTTPLRTDSILEGRYVRYGAPAMMRISQPTTVTLVRQGSEYVGEVYIPKKDVAGTMVYFRNSQQPKRTDLNKGQFYVIPVWDAAGHIVPHATGGQASVFTRTHLPAEAGVRADPNWVVTLLESELAQHPDLRPQYWYDLVAAQIKQRKPGYGPKVKASIESYLASRPQPSPTELADAARLYESVGDFASVKLLRERQKSAEPAGSMVQKDRAMAIRTEPNWVRKKVAYTAFRQEFPTASYLPALTIMMTDDYYKQNDIAGMMTFVGQQPDSFVDALMLNAIAFKMADERRSLPEAEQLIKRALTVLKAQPKPADVTGDWAVEKKNRHRQLMDTYARALEQQGNYPDAYAAYQEVINPADVEASPPGTLERYFISALRTNHAAQALPVVEEAVQIDKATKSLKATLHDWYARQPGNTPAKADTYLAGLEADVKADKQDELQQKLINEPAPAFSLTDLKGRTISSAALKGKVVVLDFWATWCGPCIASFPAMQQAQNRFKTDPNVRFLFVNTREGGPVQRVYNFMDKHAYDFVVPLDGQQKMANAYKVQGIPTKIIIGPNGRVRYRSIGYNGNPDATVDELALVVEMLKDGK